jgi:hypothetical protein
MTDDAMWVPPPSWFEVREEARRRLANLTCGLAAAALEELRVRAAERRVDDRWGHVLREARIHMPIGARR